MGAIIIFALSPFYATGLVRNVCGIFCAFTVNEFQTDVMFQS